MKKVIKETRRKGNADEVLVLSHYEQDRAIFVDLDVLTKDGRINMARTEHKTTASADQFFAESEKAMGDVYGFNKPM